MGQSVCLDRLWRYGFIDMTYVGGIYPPNICLILGGV